MSLREWMDNDPEQCQHAQFCPACREAEIERLVALARRLVNDTTTTEEGPA